MAERVYDERMPTYSTNGHFDPASVELVKRSWIELGLLPQMPDDSQIYTTKFLQ